MDKSRRGFFRNLCGVSVLAGAPILNTIGDKAESKEQKASVAAGFPVVMSVKYYFPQDRNYFQVKEDVRSWGDEKSFYEIFNKLEKENRVSPNLQYTVHKDHHLFQMFFKDMESYNEYLNYMKTHAKINTELQKTLGYKIISDISYV